MSKIQEKSKESLRLNVEEFEVEESVKVKKEQWGNEVEFLLSCITLSVGLGNVWRYCRENFYSS